MESTPHCYDNLFQKSPLLDCLNCYHCFYRFLMKKLRKQLPDVFYEKKVFLKVSQNLQTPGSESPLPESLFLKNCTPMFRVNNKDTRTKPGVLVLFL